MKDTCFFCFSLKQIKTLHLTLLDVLLFPLLHLILIAHIILSKLFIQKLVFNWLGFWL